MRFLNDSKRHLINKCMMIIHKCQAQWRKNYRQRRLLILWKTTQSSLCRRSMRNQCNHPISSWCHSHNSNRWSKTKNRTKILGSRQIRPMLKAKRLKRSQQTIRVLWVSSKQNTMMTFGRTVSFPGWKMSSPRNVEIKKSRMLWIL